MPNRILRDWTDSERVNALSAPAERFFVRLIMKADDYGCFHGNPVLLKSLLFPLKDIRIADVTRWIDECKKSGLIVEYEHESKRFVAIVGYGQRLKNSRRHFPPPPDVSDNFPKLPGTSGNFPAETETETETRNGNGNTSYISPLTSVTDEGRATDAGGETKKKPEKIFFDYEGDARIHGITAEQIARWREQFPALDIEAQLKAASAWLDGNRKNRKTDIRRFLTNWLIREQDRAKTVNAPAPRRGYMPPDYDEITRRAEELRARQGDDPRFEEVN